MYNLTDEDIDNFNDCFEAIEAEIWKFDIQ